MIRGEGCKRHIRAQRLSHAHGDGRFASARRARNQHCSASNLALLGHLQNDRSGLAGFLLADQALCRWFDIEGRGIDPKSSDMRVHCDQVQATYFPRFTDGLDILRQSAAHRQQLKPCSPSPWLLSLSLSGLKKSFWARSTNRTRLQPIKTRFMADVCSNTAFATLFRSGSCFWTDKRPSATIVHNVAAPSQTLDLNVNAYVSKPFN